MFSFIVCSECCNDPLADRMSGRRASIADGCVRKKGVKCIVAAVWTGNDKSRMIFAHVVSNGGFLCGHAFLDGIVIPLWRLISDSAPHFVHSKMTKRESYRIENALLHSSPVSHSEQMSVGTRQWLPFGSCPRHSIVLICVISCYGC
jgi:hypothetical protein